MVNLEQRFRIAVGKWTRDQSATASAAACFRSGKSGQNHLWVLAQELFPAEPFDDGRPPVDPQFPDTYWSFKHALRFVGKGSTASPGADDGCALPAAWNKRLIDMNVERLRDRDLDRANVVMLSGMHIQSESLIAIVGAVPHARTTHLVGGDHQQLVTH